MLAQETKLLRLSGENGKREGKREATSRQAPRIPSELSVSLLSPELPESLASGYSLLLPPVWVTGGAGHITNFQATTWCLGIRCPWERKPERTYGHRGLPAVPFLTANLQLLQHSRGSKLPELLVFVLTGMCGHLRRILKLSTYSLTSESC